MLTTLGALLAQPGSDENAAALIKIAITCGVLLVLAGALGVWALLARRRALRRDSEGPGLGFGIEDLEGLRKAGQISDEEFRMLRRRSMRQGLGDDKPKGNKELNAGPKPDDGK